MMRSLKSRKLVFILAMLFLINAIVSLKFITYSSANQLASKSKYIEYNFENKSVSPLAKYPSNVVLKVTNSTCAEGTFSVLVAGRKNANDGVIVDITKFLDFSREYEVSFYVLQTTKKLQRISVTLEILDSNDKNQVIAAEKVLLPNIWTKVSAKVQASNYKKAKRINLIVNMPTSKSDSFYIDLFTIKDLENAYVLKQENFENKNTGGFLPEDKNCKITLAKDRAYSSAYSLKVQPSQKTKNGKILFPIKGLLQKGGTYDFSLLVYQDSSKPVNFSAGIKLNDGKSTKEIVLAKQNVAPKKWTQLFATLDLDTRFSAKDVSFFVKPAAAISYYLDLYSISDENWGQPVPDYNLPSLCEKYKNYFKIGVAVPYRALTNPVDVEVIKRHFNSITPENEMKPESLQPYEGGFSFSIADEYVDFCKKNNISLRGHTLVWHQQTPSWFFTNPETGEKLTNSEKDKKILLDRLKKHIQIVVGRYKGKVYAWDVVNEAIDENQPDGYRRSDWYNILGPEYIEKAFIWAHEADPKAKLFYNDYSTEDPYKREFIYKLIKNLKAKGVPVHGVGLQCHISLDWPDVSEIEETVKLFSRIPGLEIHFTEIDISIAKNMTDDDAYNRYLLVQQAQKLKAIFDVLKKYRNVVTSVTFWGLKDDYSWLRGDMPLLFDKDYQPKFAFWSLIDPSVVPKE
ncbi:endo-1,4-beta-xylanase [Caldicellulosiruptor morganii]|uniref:Beta-xylanase n=1 Tax=Caldicellulosiruptor morganii TaxID=1387555 RepID=A0ABY7BPW9_9FIRM|nr:endo-1,4-beta-xylanase [Caldicellulosiruptor morganii]WAM33576.1 endo-1,4-beta-xylanase [Caldicellulosiruptor morganii]